jgi:ComF family protein
MLHAMLPHIREALLDAWAVLMPVECAGCTAPDRALCTGCRARLSAEPVWHSLPDGTRLVSALDYADEARQVILAFKENGRTDAATALAVALRCALLAAASAATDGAVEPELALVPTSRRSYRRRGYDPVAVLVKRAGFRHSRVLCHNRTTLQQKTLDVESRHRNLVGSLRAVAALDGRRFIVVDDVGTTGATLIEASRAIREAGGEVISAVTLAHTERHFRPSPAVS